MPHEYDEIYAGVAKGDPRLSSAETGVALVEQLVDLCARFVKHFAERTPSSDLGMGGAKLEYDPPPRGSGVHRP